MSQNGTGNETDESFRVFSHNMDGIGTVIVVLLGLVLNGLSCAVYSGIRPSTCIHAYLVCLGCWDSCLLLTALLMYSAPHLLYGHDWGQSGASYLKSIPYWYALGNMSLVGPLWVIVALTIDRYNALCHPFWHYRHMSDRTMVNKLLVSVSVCAFFYGIPRFFEVEAVYSQRNGSDVLEVKQTALIDNHLYLYLYKITGQLLCYSLAPFLILLFLTLRISLELKRCQEKRQFMTSIKSSHASPRREKLRHPTKGRPEVKSDQSTAVESKMEASDWPIFTSGRPFPPTQSTRGRKPKPKGPIKTKTSNRGNQTNFLLLAVIIKYLISHVMPTVLDIVQVFPNYINPNPSMQNYAVAISNFIVTINSATNFWVYILGSRNFRKHFLKFMGKKKEPELKREFCQIRRNSAEIRLIAGPALTVQEHSFGRDIEPFKAIEE